MPSALLEPVAPPPTKKKFPQILQKECFGTFRNDFSEEKKEGECYACSKYVDCIQISYKKQRSFKQEIRRLVAGLQKRIEVLTGEASGSAA